MKIFYGVCHDCSHQWEIIGKNPNFCPECGHSLWLSMEQMLAFQKSRIHDCRNNVIDKSYNP
jgi:rRNA maturation endonuclease Nob1